MGTTLSWTSISEASTTGKRLCLKVEFDLDIQAEMRV